MNHSVWGSEGLTPDVCVTTETYLVSLVILTPTGNDILHDAGIVVEDVQENEVVKIYAFHENPVVVGKQRVLYNYRKGFTGNTLTK